MGSAWQCIVVLLKAFPRMHVLWLYRKYQDGDSAMFAPRPGKAADSGLHCLKDAYVCVSDSQHG